MSAIYTKCSSNVCEHIHAYVVTYLCVLLLKLNWNFRRWNKAIVKIIDVFKVIDILGSIELDSGQKWLFFFIQIESPDYEILTYIFTYVLVSTVLQIIYLFQYYYKLAGNWTQNPYIEELVTYPEQLFPRLHSLYKSSGTLLSVNYIRAIDIIFPLKIILIDVHLTS